MARLFASVVLVVSFALSAFAQSATKCANAPAPSYSMKPAKGWSVTPVLGQLTKPRGLVVDQTGNLLVVERGKGITGHKVDADGCVTSSATLVSDTTLTHGIALHPSGNRLFASSPNTTWSWDYDSSGPSVSNRTPIIIDIPSQGFPTRTLLSSTRYPNLLIVSIGSTDNVDEGAFAASQGRAQVRVFDLSRIPSGGAVFTDSRYSQILAYGLRNAVGLTEDRSGGVFSVENSIDDANRTVSGVTTDVHDENPAEKVDTLGDPSSPSGSFKGAPYCFTVWNPKSFKDSSKKAGDWFTQNPNSTINDAWCDQTAQKPTVLLPPHTAPLDMKFGMIQNDANLYISLHGSFDVNEPVGYKVIYVPGKYSSSGQWAPSSSKLVDTKKVYQDVLSNDDQKDCKALSGCFRPVGLAFRNPGISLYVSSDTSGEVFLVQRTSAALRAAAPPVYLIVLLFVVFQLL